MAFSVDEIQDDILEYLRGQFVQPVQDDYLPNTETVARNALGEIEPYLVVQFGDLQPQNAYAMSGSWDDDYGMPVYVQCISADPKIGRKLANKCIRVLLGRSFPWSGQIRKRAGFNMFTIDSSDNSVEAYAFPLFFTVLVQVSTEA